jgi:hypothetical protein
MINFIVGVALGAAFAPFWMKVYAWGKALAAKFMKTPPSV